jgi:hypothetical protein
VNSTNDNGTKAAIANVVFLRARRAPMTAGRVFMSELSSPSDIVNPIACTTLKAEELTGSSEFRDMMDLVKSRIFSMVGVVSCRTAFDIIGKR